MHWIGAFNYQGQVITLKTEAVTERQAWQNCCHGLAARCGVRKRVIMNYFNGEHNNFEIKEEHNGI